MKTLGVVNYLRIFPLIVVLTLSGCGGAGNGGAESGKLSDAECEDLSRRMQLWADLTVASQVEAMEITQEGIADLDAGYDVDVDAVAAESDKLMKQGSDAAEKLNLTSKEFEIGQCEDNE